MARGVCLCWVVWTYCASIITANGAYTMATSLHNVFTEWIETSLVIFCLRVSPLGSTVVRFDVSLPRYLPVDVQCILKPQRRIASVQFVRAACDVEIVLSFENNIYLSVGFSQIIRRILDNVFELNMIIIMCTSKLFLPRWLKRFERRKTQRTWAPVCQEGVLGWIFQARGRWRLKPADLWSTMCSKNYCNLLASGLKIHIKAG